MSTQNETAQPTPPSPSFTKIVATIGPASEDRVSEMIDLGLSVARVNFSHGTREDHARRIQKIRAAAAERQVSVGILADLPGPKMRTAQFPGHGIELEENQDVVIRSGSGVAAVGEILIDVPGLVEAVQPGHRILLADGQVEAIAELVQNDAIIARVRRGGLVSNRKGVHLPDSAVNYQLPTDEDRELLQFAIEQDVDMIGISFVGNAAEIHEIRALAPDMVLVAKIERTAAIANLAEILEATDGVMVARGDLGVEVELEQLPITQKTVINAALRAGKFTITATEMLESMITQRRPTRAEVTDVANAVLDGTDAVMLSAETAVGDWPVETVATMSRIASAVEDSQRYSDLPRQSFLDTEANFSNATAMAAVRVARALSLQKIICFTETGNTVRLISLYRPNATIIALCPNSRAVNHMTVLSHVRPILFRREQSLEDMLYIAAEMLVVRGLATYGEEVVFVAGVPPGVALSTNVMKLHRIGEEVKLH